MTVSSLSNLAPVPASDHRPQRPWLSCFQVVRKSQGLLSQGCWKHFSWLICQGHKTGIQIQAPPSGGEPPVCLQVDPMIPWTSQVPIYLHLHATTSTLSPTMVDAGVHLSSSIKDHLGTRTGSRGVGYTSPLMLSLCRVAELLVWISEEDYMSRSCSLGDPGK